MMRFAGVLGVLALVAAPAMAAEQTFDFDVTDGSIVLSIEGVGSTSSGIQGEFQVAIDTTDLMVGESDTVLFGAASISNADAMQLEIPGVATANVGPGDAGILNFIQPVAAHIGAGGIAQVETDAFLDATVIVTGPINTTFATSTSAGELLPLNVTMSSDGTTVTAMIDFTFVYSEYIPDIGMTLTLDLVMQIEGQAAAIPEPTFGGLTALGLAGAGSWLRRRRS